MKRYILSFIGIVLLLGPVPVQATSMGLNGAQDLLDLLQRSGIGQQSQAGGVPGTPMDLGPTYIERVLQRTSDGIAAAQGMTPASYFPVEYFISYAGNIRSTMVSFIDTNLRIIHAQEDPSENSACLHADLFILEIAIKIVQDEMQKALLAQNVTGLWMLRDLAEFLNERMEILLKGAREPLYVDESWNKTRSFDPPKSVFCCVEPGTGAACVSGTVSFCALQNVPSFNTNEDCGRKSDCSMMQDRDPTEKLCPFHSNYLPPTVSAGYGCDAEALTALLDRLNGAPQEIIDVVTAEKIGIERVQGLLKDSIEQARAFLTFQNEINELLGRESDDLPEVPPEREHKEVYGCINAWETTNPDEEIKDAWPFGAIKWTRLGTFSFEWQDPLVEQFEQLRRNEAEQRPPPGFFDPKATAIQENFLELDYEEAGARKYTRFSTAQGSFEAQIFPQGSDAYLSIAESVKTLMKSVANLSKLAKDMEGLRGFVRDFAYYLRRSCLDRPCSTRLDQVLKIVFKDECFPYTDGEFEQSEDSVKKCAEAAKIEVIEKKN